MDYVDYRFARASVLWVMWTISFQVYAMLLHGLRLDAWR